MWNRLELLHNKQHMCNSVLVHIKILPERAMPVFLGFFNTLRLHNKFDLRELYNAATELF